MTNETTPRHALYVRYGRFQLSAVGCPAIIALVVIVAGFVATRALGWW